MEDNIWWKPTFLGRHLMKDKLQWRGRMMVDNHLMEDKYWWKTDIFLWRYKRTKNDMLQNPSEVWLWTQTLLKVAISQPLHVQSELAINSILSWPSEIHNIYVWNIAKLERKWSVNFSKTTIPGQSKAEKGKHLTAFHD